MFVREDELAPPPKGSWFIHDIIGCSVVLEDGTPLGIVKDVWQMPGNDLWEIIYQGKPVMVPAAKEFIKNVDIAGKKIILAPPDGLFEVSSNT
jgi:16S rRNA processing protein RimM